MQFESSSGSPENGPLSAPGIRLRQARERRGDSIVEVAQALKLAPRQVEALERGDHDALPGPAFVRGFMRNYARYLGLDPEPLLAQAAPALAQLRVDLSPLTNAAGDLPTEAGRRRARKGVGAAALLAGALVVVLLLGAYFDWFETTPSLPVATEPQAQQVPPQPSESAAVPLPQPLQPPAEPAPATDGVVANAATPVEAEVEAVAPGAAAAPVPAEEAAPPAEGTTATGAAAGTLVFGFDAQSWVEVRDRAGRVIYAGTNQAGTTRTVQGQPPFALVVGNAHAVRLEHGGSAVDLAPHVRGTVARLTVN